MNIHLLQQLRTDTVESNVSEKKIIPSLSFPVCNSNTFLLKDNEVIFNNNNN